MASLIIEHVKSGDLPPDWAKKLHASSDVTFTVAIVEESGTALKEPISSPEDFPLFGVWKDNENTDDVAGYVRSLRKNRF